MPDEKPTGTIQKDRHRSPAWPFIPLSKAVERAREFYKVHRERSAAASAANVAWGMGSKSGAGFQTAATIKQYGLLKEAERGSVQLTDLALRIVQDPRAISAERDAAYREAAIKPPIFADLWQKWDADIPDDASVEYYLVREKGFSEDVAKKLLANYKASLSLAKVLESDSVADNGGLEADESLKIPKTPKLLRNPLPPAQGVTLMEGERIVFTHELEPSHGVRVLASGEVDATMIDALELYIQLQKKRLVRQESPPVPPKETGELASPPSAGKPQSHRLGAVIIAKANKARLREKGYTDEQMDKMKPEEALEILGI